ncbi:MAG: DUF4411 family protein, partial [Undibacterium sp.]
KNGGYSVVTEEKPDPARRNRIKIPDVCLKFNVPYINTVALLRLIGAKF